MFNSPDPDALRYRQSKLGIKLSSKWDPAGAELDQALNVMDLSLQEEKERQRKAEEQAAKKKKGWDPLDELNFNFNT